MLMGCVGLFCDKYLELDLEDQVASLWPIKLIRRLRGNDTELFIARLKQSEPIRSDVLLN